MRWRSSASMATRTNPPTRPRCSKNSLRESNLAWPENSQKRCTTTFVAAVNAARMPAPSHIRLPDMMIADPAIWTMMVSTAQSTGGYIPNCACAATAALKSAISTIAATMNIKVSRLRAMGHVHRHSRITSTQSGSGGSDFHCVTALVSRSYADSGCCIGPKFGGHRIAC